MALLVGSAAMLGAIGKVIITAITIKQAIAVVILFKKNLRKVDMN
jgi:hypothetical protein